MSWQKVVLVTLYAVNIFLVWGEIDQPRKPYTHGMAFFLSLWTAGIMALVIYA